MRRHRSGGATTSRKTLKGFAIPPWTNYLGRAALLATLYVVTGKLGLLLAVPPGYATIIWPASGVMLPSVGSSQGLPCTWSQLRSR